MHAKTSKTSQAGRVVPYHDPRVGSPGAASGSQLADRGGSWDDYAGGCRSASRLSRTPNNRAFNFGFRAARTLP